jgi:hypothetical protein
MGKQKGIKNKEKRMSKDGNFVTHYSLNFHPIGQRGSHQRIEALIQLFPEV